ncbi:MAG: helix-turn-helix transcriptional regulator [Phycisphaerae bacterium]|nr:helix-turn-helix transcriptional regulator [Phycisphaerae bacterium]
MSALPVQILDSVDQAAALMDPARIRLLRELREPDSASGLAKRTGQPRQRLNYHLRELERVGLVKLVEERRRRNCTERMYQATARAYLVSPEALDHFGREPEVVQDRFSWAYLVSLAARAVRDLAVLRRRADRAGKKLATLALDADVRVASPRELTEIMEGLTAAIQALAKTYHNESAPGGRTFRVMVGAYPAITRDEEESENEGGDETAPATQRPEEK